MVRKVLVAALLSALLASAPAALAARPGPPIGDPVLPQQIPVPAEVIAAHPNGVPLVARAVVASLPADVGNPRRAASRRDAERVYCWRAYFTGDNGGWFGTEQEVVNPYWCGNGSVMRNVDQSYHYQSCSILVSCQGENGPFGWFGCTYGCASYGGEVIGRFSVYLLTEIHVDETVLYELYGNGQYWSYAYHN
jgi:hypothetical protein